jgi:hypothetical protein
MELEEGLYAYLVSRPAVTALISTRIYPVFLPQNKLRPALVYARVNTQPDPQDLQGDPLMRAIISLVVWGKDEDDYGTCKAITTVVRQELLSPTRGTWGEIGLHGVTWLDQKDVFEESLILPGVQAEYSFIFSE